MSKGSKKKKDATEITSLATIEHIAGRVLTDKEKAAEPAALALIKAHKELEDKGVAFAAQFRCIKAATEEVQRLLPIVITAREFILDNRDFLREVREFFSKNRGRKIKQTLNGHLTLELWSKEMLGCDDHYLRQVFSSTEKTFVSVDGTKLLTHLTDAEKDAAKKERDEAAEAKKAEKVAAALTVTRALYGDRLARTTIESIINSRYTVEEKHKIVAQVLKHLTGYGLELRQEISTITVAAEVGTETQSAAAITEAATT